MDTDEAGRRAFVAMYERYYGDVLRYARRRTDEQQARDITSETFLVAWRRFDAVPEHALPWLYAVARNTLAQELRRRRREMNLARRLRAAAAAGALTVDPDHAERLADGNRLAGALARLPPRDREAVQLISWEGLKVKDAATVMGCTVTVMSVRLHRARRRLARLLDEGEAQVSRPTTEQSAAYTEAH